MGNDTNAGRALISAANGAKTGNSIVPVVGAFVGAEIGGLVGLFSDGDQAQHAQADLGGNSIDARAIWEKINPGSSGSLDAGTSAASALAQAHNDRVTHFQSLAKTMDAAWQGDSAAAAQAGSKPLVTWLQDSADKLQQTSAGLTQQSGSFHTVKSQVQEIAQEPPSAGLLDKVNPWSDVDEDINKYNQGAHANVQAYQSYYQASGANGQGLPAFSKWQGNQLSDGTPATSTPGTATGATRSVGGSPAHSASGSRFDRSATSGGSPTHNPGFSTGPGTSGSPSANLPGSTGNPLPGNDSTATAGYVPAAATTPFDSAGGGFGPTGGSGSSSGWGGGAGGFGAGGFGPGIGAPGAGGPASGATSGPGGGGGTAGLRGGSAMGAAGKAGSSGMGGMGSGAGKGGKGAEDEEHTTKYLLKEDGEGLFGTDVRAVPPVIGE